MSGDGLTTTKSIGSPMSAWHKGASEARVTNCTTATQSQDCTAEETPGTHHQQEVDVASAADDVDLPCAESRLSHAKVDKGSCYMLKKKVFDICSFLTDSLGETVAQGMNVSTFSVEIHSLKVEFK